MRNFVGSVHLVIVTTVTTTGAWFTATAVGAVLISLFASICIGFVSVIFEFSSCIVAVTWGKLKLFVSGAWFIARNKHW